ncbi:MAG: hypothetical protein KDK35_00015 [Leptospiraceae bacterium]|nr:hypothetical protein [Leptospiraceae bacterium]MCP5484911.1 hypothetical protein [Spirochaetales bacterium]
MWHYLFEPPRLFFERLFLPRVIGPRRLPEIEKFRNIHKGEECYLFGDGISLKYFDLKNFKDRISIPVAYLPFHRQFSELRVPYSFVVEPYWFYPLNRFTEPPFHWLPNVIQRKYHEIIKKRSDIHFFMSLTNWPMVRQPNVIFVNSGWKYPSLPEAHIGNTTNVFAGSVNSAIFLSIFMGFQKVYLVGFDYTHDPAVSHHWYERGKGIVTENPAYNKEFFDAARQYIHIVTVTREGRAPILDSITYRQLTGAEPEFKENDELLEPAMIEAIATWPQYKMYD